MGHSAQIDDLGFVPREPRTLNLGIYLKFALIKGYLGSLGMRPRYG